jgi:hypothetical protein
MSVKIRMDEHTTRAIAAIAVVAVAVAAIIALVFSVPR